jgi:hypothetical protein
VRRWRKTLLDDGVSTITMAKAYRLLKAILNTAARDGVIRRISSHTTARTDGLTSRSKARPQAAGSGSESQPIGPLKRYDQAATPTQFFNQADLMLWRV